MLSRRIATMTLGVFLLSGITLLAVTKEEKDTAKYAQILKTASTAKDKVDALKELGRLGQIQAALTKDLIPDITKCLDDKDPGVRAEAAHSLGKIDPPNKSEVVSKLVKMLKDEKAEVVKGGAAMGLGAMGPDAMDAVTTLREVREKAGKKDVNAQVYQTALRQITGKKK